MISRETYRVVKKMAMCRVLHDRFGFGEKRLRELLAGQESDMEAIHQRLISAAEIQEGLAAEGCDLNRKGE